MNRKKGTFKYLRDATPTDRMVMRDGFEYIDRAMTFFGWLAPSEKNIFSNYGLYKLVRVFFLASALYLPIGLSITYVKEFSTFTPGELFNSLQAGINSPGAFIKAVVSVIHIWRFIALKDKFEEMNKRCVNDEEQLEVHQGAKLCNIAYLTYLIVYSVFGFLTVLTSLLRRVVPWRIYNPFLDWRAGTSSLLLGTCYEWLFMGTGIFYNHINDCLPLILAIVIRLNISLLNKRIKNLRTDPNRSEEQNYNDLRACINDHRQIIEACDLMRPPLSQWIFVQFLLVGLLFGLTMINLMFFANIWTGISSAAYAFALIFQTFPFCYTCTLIDTDCDDLAISVFHSNWLDAKPRYKTTIQQFLHNVQRNITFTAGIIFPICLNTNISVAKLAFSVVTFVKQMNIAEKLKAA